MKLSYITLRILSILFLFICLACNNIFEGINTKESKSVQNTPPYHSLLVDSPWTTDYSSENAKNVVKWGKKDVGFNHIALKAGLFTENLQSNIVKEYICEPDTPIEECQTACGKSSPSQKSIEDIIKVIHSTGMNFSLAVYLDLENWCEDTIGLWRGNIQPSDPDVFFQNYSDKVISYAALAEKYSATFFSIGSELRLLSGEGYRGYWIDLIKKVREVYSGSITYQATFPNFGGTSITIARQENSKCDAEYSCVAFWDALDFASINLFPHLSYEKQGEYNEKTVEAMSWFYDKLRTFQQKINIPLYISEVGFPSRTYCLDRSFLSVDSRYGAFEYNEKCQADGYRTFFHVFSEKPDWFLGFSILEDIINHESDDHYSPRGKEVEEVLKQNLLVNKE